MKQNLFLKSMCGLAVVVCMTSCVAKKKYTEAQNQIATLQSENARLNETGATMQTNITSLETQNRTLQTSLDSTNTWASGQQTRWNSFQAFYDEGTKTVEQVHQQLHQQLDELIGTENITSANGRVHVNLAEKTLFASGSSKLTAKGSQILETVAMAIKDNPNVEIDIASSPGYYTDGSMSSTTNSSAMNSDMNNQNTTTTTTATDNSKMKSDEDGDAKYKDANTKVKMDRDGDVKVKTSASKSSSYSGAAKKSTTYKSTARKSESKSKTYSSSPSRKAVSSSSKWSLNMARSSNIAKKLVDEGVAKSRILVGKENSSDNTTAKDYQIIISPKTDTYYKSIGTGSGTNQ
jgi:outer membrane protein OmpA-like peptidoglycan-associated protein